MKKQFGLRHKRFKGFFRIHLRNKNFKFGLLGLICPVGGFISEAQLEALRRIITRYLGRSNYLWIRVQKVYPFFAKPQEVRMGKGKGAFSHFIYRIHAGQVLFEFDFIPLKQQKLLMAALKSKSSTGLILRPIA